MSLLDATLGEFGGARDDGDKVAIKILHLSEQLDATLGEFGGAGDDGDKAAIVWLETL